MPYVSFISDDHFRQCVGNLYNSYVSAHKKVNRTKFYKNKIDVIKLSFDKHFEQLSEDELIKREITRQIDKSINNAIGEFHEEVLGGVTGYEKGIKSIYDIKASDNTLFADIKNKHNTMNSKTQESLYLALTRLAKENPNSRCYCVNILSKSSYINKWNASFRNRIYKHNQVYICSGDKFYELITGKSDALYQIYKMLPSVIADYFQINNITHHLDNNSSALKEIQDIAASTTRTLLNQIAHDNYSKYYNGFNEL